MVREENRKRKMHNVSYNKINSIESKFTPTFFEISYILHKFQYRSVFQKKKNVLNVSDLHFPFWFIHQQYRARTQTIIKKRLGLGLRPVVISSIFNLIHSYFFL